MGLLARQQRSVRLKRQRGEMPIGPVLIIALIVLPLVIVLVIYGGKISESFTDATDRVSDASGDGASGFEDATGDIE